MVFSSITFIFYILPLFWAADVIFRASGKNALRNFAFLCISLLFYTWGEGKNVFLLLVLAMANYAFGLILYRYGKKLILAVFIIFNLSVLFQYKYFYWLFSFFSANGIHHDLSPMPLGISFFTFHAISYIIDVYRKDIRPAGSAIDFLTYFCMFPHLVAGPIVRYAQISHELPARGPDRDLFNFGVYRFLVGLNKKVIIANSVSILADSAFTVSTLDGGLGTGDAWIGILAYTIQIYFDFSGYSDMAIGLAAMAGFKFEENFKRPYSSKSIKEFWRRWHISLSSWFRDYLYFPLGGNRKGKLVSYRNMLIVFILCGLWHGADITFLIWGLWHGCFLVIERFKPVDRILNTVPQAVQRFYTLLVVMIGWTFFRAENMATATAYLHQMFRFDFSRITLTFHAFGCIMLVIAVVLCLLPDRWTAQPTSHTPASCSSGIFALQMALAIISIAMLLSSSRNPFIYFNF